MLDAAKPECIIHSLCVQYSCCCYHLHPFACMPHQVWRKHYVLTDQRPDSVRRKKPETRVSTLTGITQKKEAKEMPTTNAKKKKKSCIYKAEQSRAGEEEAQAKQSRRRRRSTRLCTWTTIRAFFCTYSNECAKTGKGGRDTCTAYYPMDACMHPIRSDHRPSAEVKDSAKPAGRAGMLPLLSSRLMTLPPPSVRPPASASCQLFTICSSGRCRSMPR